MWKLLYIKEYVNIVYTLVYIKNFKVTRNISFFFFRNKARLVFFQDVYVYQKIYILLTSKININHHNDKEKDCFFEKYWMISGAERLLPFCFFETKKIIQRLKRVLKVLVFYTIANFFFF